jgi:hypothetical protein
MHKPGAVAENSKLVQGFILSIKFYFRKIYKYLYLYKVMKLEFIVDKRIVIGIPLSEINLYRVTVSRFEKETEESEIFEEFGVISEAGAISRFLEQYAKEHWSRLKFHWIKNSDVYSSEFVEGKAINLISENYHKMDLVIKYIAMGLYKKEITKVEKGNSVKINLE